MIQRAESKNLQMWLEGIDQFNATPGAGTTRILFTAEELACRTYVKEQMEQLGLSVSEDAIGNIFGVLPGSCQDLAPVWTGSHIDTVPNAGMFDGMAGVVSGMEALRLIKESGIRHKRDLAVVVYTSEEPTRFGLSCLGSRALAGELTLEGTRQIKDQNGQSLYELLAGLGYDLRKYRQIPKRPGDVYASVELHIEQNRQLDQAGIPLGIVRGICAPTIFRADIFGCQSHAGGTGMADRKDAFAAACELSLLVEKLALESAGEYLTATVGRVEVQPGAVNVIPGFVSLSIDIRSIDMESKRQLTKSLHTGIRQIEKSRGVTINIYQENDDQPLSCDGRIKALIEDSCKRRGIPSMELISGPYHDSLFAGRFTPAAMIFVPSKDGISHSKDEWTDFDDIALGTDVLAETLLTLANEE